MSSNAEEVQVVPAVEEVATPAVVENIYEYQPTDQYGRALGGKQVIKYTDQADLIAKLTKQNTELVSLNRDLVRKNRLGQIENEALPETVQRAQIGYQPTELTEDERIQLSRDLLDPEKFEDASDRLFEAKIGAKPAAIRQSLSQIDVLTARAEADAWINSQPDYYKCKENFETLTNWMIKNDLAPIRQNFQLAFEKLKAVGLLFDAPIVREDAPAPPVSETVQQLPNSQAVQEEPSRITTEEPAQSTRTVVRTPSGLNRTTASPVGVPAQRQTLTLADIEKMPSAEYKRRLLTDPSFGKTIDELYAKAQQQ